MFPIAIGHTKNESSTESRADKVKDTTVGIIKKANINAVVIKLYALGILKIIFNNGPRAVTANKPKITDGISANNSTPIFTYLRALFGILNLIKVAVLIPTGAAIIIASVATMTVIHNGNQTPALPFSKSYMAVPKILVNPYVFHPGIEP